MKINEDETFHDNNVASVGGDEGDEDEDEKEMNKLNANIHEMCDRNQIYKFRCCALML